MSCGWNGWVRMVLAGVGLMFLAACGGDGIDHPSDILDTTPYALDVPGLDIPADPAPADTSTSPDLIQPDTASPSDTTTDVAPDVSADVATDLPTADLPPEVTITCPAYGSILISEIMPNPKVASDANGEYFEVTNVTDVTIDLAGWSIISQTSVHAIPAGTPLRVAGNSTLLFARSSNANENGGIAPDYVFDKVTLTNEADDLVLDCQGTVIDAVVYDMTAGWPKKEGRAMLLDLYSLDADKNDDPANWCNAFATFGGGDYGSPGLVNDACGINSCGDKVVQNWEECDDGNLTDGDGCEADCTPTLVTADASES